MFTSSNKCCTLLENNQFYSAMLHLYAVINSPVQYWLVYLCTEGNKLVFIGDVASLQCCSSLWVLADFIRYQHFFVLQAQSWSNFSHPSAVLDRHKTWLSYKMTVSRHTAQSWHITTGRRSSRNGSRLGYEGIRDWKRIWQKCGQRGGRMVQERIRGWDREEHQSSSSMSNCERIQWTADNTKWQVDAPHTSSSQPVAWHILLNYIK